MNTKNEGKTATKQINKLSARWSKKLIQGGWTGIPNIILERQNALRLTPIEFNLIIQIAKFWWEKEKPPFPSVQTLSDNIGVTTRTIQRNLAELEKKSYIEKKARYHSSGGQTSNGYTYEGLIKKCKEMVAEEEAANKQQEKAQRKRKTTRQSLPDLRVVTGQ